MKSPFKVTLSAGATTTCMLKRMQFACYWFAFVQSLLLPLKLQNLLQPSDSVPALFKNDDQKSLLCMMTTPLPKRWWSYVSTSLLDGKKQETKTGINDDKPVIVVG